MSKNWTSKLNVGHQTTEFVVKNFVFILFLGGLAIIYIANAHYAEKRVREIQKKQKEIKELRWEYMTIKSDLMRKSTQSQIKEAVEPAGLRAQGKDIKIIEVDD